MIQKLTIRNGIIQDANIDGIPIKICIVTPSGKANVRTLIPLELGQALGITVHNTGNESPTASDEMHAKYFQTVENEDKNYVGAHLFVDEDSITQVLPLNEIAFHAGDGKGNGNYKTVSVEICENGMLLKAEDNAKKLNAALILTYPQLKIYKHQDWSGKYCPRVILGRNSWDQFVKDIETYVTEAQRESETPEVSDWKLNGYQYMKEEELITDYAYWLDQIETPIETWAVFLFLQKTIEKLRKEISENEDRLIERMDDRFGETRGE